MDADVESKMLNALTEDNQADTLVDVALPPLDEQKRYLIRNIDSVNRDDKLIIGNVLVMNNKRAECKWCNEGTAINLDMLPPYIVTHMYEALHLKVAKK